MAHENSVTVEVDGKYYVVSGNDGRILMGPFDNMADANYRAKIRSDMQGAREQGMPRGEGKLGLGSLGDLMDEGYQTPYDGGGPAEPDPSEYTPPGQADIYTAQRGSSDESSPRPAPGPIMLPPKRPSLGQLAQGPALDPRLQRMLEQTERGGTAGPSQQYFRGAPQPTAPNPPATGAAPGSNLPGGGPRPGETESQYLQRVLRGG